MICAHLKFHSFSCIAGTAICLLADRPPRTGRLLIAVTLLVLVAHAVFEGAHWQMIPAYAATGVLCLAAWKPGEGKTRFQEIHCMAVAAARILRASCFRFSCRCLACRNLQGPIRSARRFCTSKTLLASKMQSPAAGSARELMVQLWYPAQPSHNRFARYREPRETNAFSSYQSAILTHSRLDAPVALAGAPFPVILFNHAWGGRRTNDTFLTEELASHGYIVASIDHTYNARLVAFPDGRVVRGIASNDIDDPESSTQERVRAIWDKELAKSVADQRFVLDRLEVMNRAAGSPWFGRLDTDHAGAIGHSFGGAAATADVRRRPEGSCIGEHGRMVFRGYSRTRSEPAVAGHRCGYRPSGRNSQFKCEGGSCS